MTVAIEKHQNGVNGTGDQLGGSPADSAAADPPLRRTQSLAHKDYKTAQKRAWEGARDSFHSSTLDIKLLPKTPPLKAGTSETHLMVGNNSTRHARAASDETMPRLVEKADVGPFFFFFFFFFLLFSAWP